MKDTAGLGKFYGSTTVGRHGQIVIPAEVRRALGIDFGSKLLVFVPVNNQMLGLLKAEALQQLVNLVTTHLGEIDRSSKQFSQTQKRAQVVKSKGNK